MLRSTPFWVNLIGSLTTISLALINFFPETAEGLVGIIIISIVMFFFLIENIYLKTNWKRKEKYSKVIKKLNIGFAKLNQLDRNTKYTKDKAINAFTDLCTSISDSFKELTEQECSVCIKIIRNNKKITKERLEDIFVSTLTRDANSLIERDKSNYANALSIKNNTDFEIITKNLLNKNADKRYFFSNDLISATRSGYKNSRIDYKFYENTKTNFPLTDYYNRKKNWTVPYKSTMVVAIHPMIFNDNEIIDIRGFLCIDSSKANVFIEELDVEILLGVADTLYNYDSYFLELIDDYKTQVPSKSPVPKHCA